MVLALLASIVGGTVMATLGRSGPLMVGGSLPVTLLLTGTLGRCLRTQASRWQARAAANSCRRAAISSSGVRYARST